jgi:hypothetical protein
MHVYDMRSGCLAAKYAAPIRAACSVRNVLVCAYGVPAHRQDGGWIIRKKECLHLSFGLSIVRQRFRWVLAGL